MFDFSHKNNKMLHKLQFYELNSFNLKGNSQYTFLLYYSNEARLINIPLTFLT